MPQRKLSPEEMNTLFCSAQFIRKVEASGKPSADVYLEASDQEFTAWLKEGTEGKKKMQTELSKKRGT